MKIDTKNVRFFQAGGPAPDVTPTEQTGAPQGGAEQPTADPLAQILQMFTQGLQNQDCAALAQGAQAFIQMVQQSQGGGQAEQPVYMKRGGKVVMKKKIAKEGFDKSKFGKKSEDEGNDPKNAKYGVKLKK